MQKPFKISRLKSRGKSGDNSEGDTPVPIPNTEVKPFSADGTWRETAWESRSLPDFIYSSVAQWQSTRLLTEGLLVRVQPGEPEKALE